MRINRKEMACSLCEIYGVKAIHVSNPDEYIEQKKREVTKAIRQELRHRDAMAKQYRMAKM